MAGNPILRAGAVAVSAALLLSLAVAAAAPEEKSDKAARAEARAGAKTERKAQQRARAETRAETKAAKRAQQVEAKAAKQAAQAERKQTRQKPEKVTLCHKPDTPDETTLTVGAPAMDAHLAHGDYVGACAIEETVRAIAYVDVDGDEQFGGDDELIAKLVEVGGSHKVVLGRYPTTFDVTSLGEWGVKELGATTSASNPQSGIVAAEVSGCTHSWRHFVGGYERYGVVCGVAVAHFQDDIGGGYAYDVVFIEPGAPGSPNTPVTWADRDDAGNDRFIEVDLNW